MMKRYKETIIKHIPADKVKIKNTIDAKKSAFYDKQEYKDAKKDYEDAKKNYDKAVKDGEDQSVIDALYIIMIDTKDVYDLILKDEPKDVIEDSEIICPQIGERSLFVDECNELTLLETEIIQLSVPYWFDTGTEYLLITKDNYKNYDLKDILKEKTDKYD